MRLVAAPLSPELEADLAVQSAAEWKRRWEKRRDAREGNGQSEGVTSQLLRPGSRAPAAGEDGCWGCESAPLRLRLSAKQGLTGRRAGTQGSHLTLLPPPSGLRRPKLLRGAFGARPTQRPEREPDRDGVRSRRGKIPGAPGWVWRARECAATQLPPGCGAQEASPPPLLSCGEGCT